MCCCKRWPSLPRCHPDTHCLLSIQFQPVGPHPSAQLITTSSKYLGKWVDFIGFAVEIDMFIISVAVASETIRLSNCTDHIGVETNSIGPDTDPCGTLQLSSTADDLDRLMTIVCTRHTRYEFNHWRGTSVTFDLQSVLKWHPESLPADCRWPGNGQKSQLQWLTDIRPWIRAA